MKRDLSTQLGEYGEQTRMMRGSLSVADVLERAAPVRPLPQPEPERRLGWPRIAGVVLAVAAVTFALFAVPYLFSGGAEETPASSPPSTAATTLAASTTLVPENAVPSTLADPAPGRTTGAVTWTEHDAPPLDPYAIEGTEFGFVALDESGSGLWTSPDGVTWTESPGPSVESASVSLHSTRSGLWLSGDDSLDWVTKNDPLELWHSSDAVSWQRVDLGESIDAPFGLWWETSINQVASVGNATIVSLEMSLEFDWAAILGIDPGAYDDFPIVEFDETRTGESDVYAVTRLVEGEEEDSQELVAEVIFVDGRNGLGLIDATTGDQLIFFPRGAEGAGTETTSDPLFALHEGGWGSRREALLVVGPDGERTVDPPIGASAPFEYCWQTLTEVDTQLLVAVCDEDGVATTFLTSDGVTWNDGPSIPPLAWFDYDPESGYWYGSTFGIGPSTHWVSSSGSDWTMLHVTADDFSELLPLDGGWAVAGSSGELFVSSDGQVWTKTAAGLTDLRMLTLGSSIVGFGEEATWVGAVAFE